MDADCCCIDEILISVTERMVFRECHSEPLRHDFLGGRPIAGRGFLPFRYLDQIGGASHGKHHSDCFGDENGGSDIHPTGQDWLLDVDDRLLVHADPVLQLAAQRADLSPASGLGDGELVGLRLVAVGAEQGQAFAGGVDSPDDADQLLCSAAKFAGVVPLLRDEGFLGQPPRAEVRAQLCHLFKRTQLSSPEPVELAALEDRLVGLALQDEHLHLAGPAVVRDGDLHHPQVR